MTASQGPEGRRATPPIGVGLLAVGLFLSCVFGGYIANDATHLAPGVDSLIQNIFGGSDAPLLAHTVLALPIVAALVYSLLSRRIQQVPGQIFTSVWLLFFFFLGVSTLFSNFKALSLSIWLEWLVYGCVLFGVVACSGRGRGPLVLLASLAASCAILALKGIVEYGQMRATDATWRVFAGWVNPNATAAMLLAGFFVALGLCLSRSRVESLLAGLAAVLIAFAIFLTGSKGAASLGLPLGTIAFGVAVTRAKGLPLAVVLGAALLEAGAVGITFLFNIPWIGLIGSVLFVALAVVILGDKQSSRDRVLRLLGCYGGLIAVLALLSVTAPRTGAGPAPGNNHAVAPIATPIQRVTSGSRTEEQSSTFRLNLWKSALHLIKEKPITGWGLATYRFESGRAGLSTSTIFAHNTYLQLLAEGGVVTFGLFAFGLGAWLWMIARHHSRLPEPSMAPLAGVIGAVVALLAHSLVDSDLYYFGIGIAFFALLGIGLLLSADSVAPEFVPKPARVLCSLGAVGLLLALAIVATADDLKARFRYDIATRPDLPTLQGDADSLSWVQSFDGDAGYLASEMKQGSAKTEALQDAYRLSPTEKVARALARQQQADGNPMAGISTLKLALLRDPNNLVTLTALMKAQAQAGDTASALATARRLVEVEKTPYFKVRSIPESVPTETFEARFDYLAPNEKDPKKRADLLADGVRGMKAYIETSHYILGNSDNGKQPDLKMPGYDSYNEARLKLDKAANAASEAARIYRDLGDRTAAAEMEADGPALAGAMGPPASAK